MTVGRTRPTWGFVAFLAAITLVRLLLSANIHLTEDEAYYRLWAQHLQPGYFDHPPMIAWWTRLGVLIAGDTPLGVRLLPVISSLIVSILIFSTGLRIGADRATAQRGAIFWNSAILVAMGADLAVPDAPTTLFWVLTIWALTRSRPWPGAGDWIAAGAAAGLAMLSKYSALFLPAGIFLWLLLTPGGARQLRRPWPWLAVALALAIFGLNIAWNADHGWVTFYKQFGRAAPAHFAPQHLFELVSGQFLLINPIIAVFLGLAAWRTWKYRRTPGTEGRMLLLLSGAPFVAYLLLHSLHDIAQAHWPAPLYPALALLAAFAAADPATPRARVCRTLAPLIGLGLAAVAYLHLLMPASRLLGTHDPSLEVKDWPSFARRVDETAKARGARWVGTLSYGTTAQLDEEFRGRIPVVQLAERARWLPTDSSWRADLGRPGLVLDLGKHADPARLAACFDQVQPLGTLVRGPIPAKATAYPAFLVQGPRRDVLKDGC